MFISTHFPALVRAGGVMIRLASVGLAVGSTSGIGMQKTLPAQRSPTGMLSFKFTALPFATTGLSSPRDKKHSQTLKWPGFQPAELA